jgi:DNA-binding CsgD family transcriptional regulator
VQAKTGKREIRKPYKDFRLAHLVARRSEEIGDMLHLSDRTVDWHIEHAIKRLDAKNRVQAVVLAMQKGALTI